MNKAIELEVILLLLVLLAIVGALFLREIRTRQAFAAQATDLRLAKRRAELDGYFRTEILESLDENVLACDTDGKVLFFNRTALKLSLDEVRALDIYQLSARARIFELDGVTPIPPDQIPIITALRGVTTVGRDVVVETAEGERHVRRVTARPMLSADGEFLGAVSVTVDVTEQIESNRRLEVASRFYKVAREMICTTDRKARFVDVNGSWTETLGWSREELIGHSMLEFVDPAERKDSWEAGTRVFDDAPLHHFRQRFLHKDGSWRWLEWNATGVPGENLIYGSARDVTEQILLEDELDSERAKLARAQSLARMGSFERDFVTGEVKWSDELRRMFAIPLDGVLPAFDELENYFHPDDIQTVHAMHRAVLAEGKEASCEARAFPRDAPEKEITVSINVAPVFDDLGNVVKIIGATIDISDRKQMENRLQFLADHDPLTELPNRRRFDDVLGRHISLARRHGSSGAVLMVDIDRLKQINDQLGHQAGDELIRAAAGAMAQRLRGHDVIARLGGDEFAVLLPESSFDGAHSVAESLLEAIGTRTVKIGNDGVTSITASIGIALISELPKLSVHCAVAAADTAMYEAKASGRNCVAVFDAAQPVKTTLSRG